MARSSKLKPAVQSLYFNVPSSGNTNFATSYVDLSLAASAINRRFYRQGINWAVSGFTFYSESSSDGTVQISKLPDTWAVANSWTKSFALWRQMQEQVAEDNESLRARYNDFKIYADQDMVNAPIQSSYRAQIGEILLPVSGPPNSAYGANQGYVVKYGAWDYSDITIPNDPDNAGAVTDYALHMIGDDVTGANRSKGMLQGYGESRSRPQDFDPNQMDVTGWMIELFDVGEQLDEVRANFADENDAPPYRVGAADPASGTHALNYIPGASQNIPTMEIHSGLSFTGTTVSSKQQVRGTNFQCGLMRLDTTGFDTSSAETSSNLYMQVHLVPGMHSGYLCMPMQEVN